MRIVDLHATNGKYDAIHRLAKISNESTSIILQIIIESRINFVFYSNGRSIRTDNKIQTAVRSRIFAINLSMVSLGHLRSHNLQKGIRQETTEAVRIRAPDIISQSIAEHILVSATVDDIEK